ncbi:hypothetical protein BS47DRAFT_1469884 [Hydnum rufescens UP504]|uniref:Uncharacterized protein n=1 Tax=Hydnum rufescens UP504 TaxID=1448309 RepID=A0A9P6DUB0_9AGAM|nr:hypothetical protein BS47DRAFT_1469884 [Hydnum rufescens UP504]
MSSRAPWDRDDRELESLKAQLRQTQVECQGLKDVILNKEVSFSQLNTDLKQAVHSLRAEIDRTAELEERSNKTQEDLRRERLHSINLQEQIKIANEKAETEAKAAANLQLVLTLAIELDNYSSTASTSFVKERTVLQDRISQLERELASLSCLSPSKSSSNTSRVPPAQIIELENKVQALLSENARLLEQLPPTSSHVRNFPISTPRRPGFNAAPFEDSPPPPQQQRRKPRRRSSSLSHNPTTSPNQCPQCTSLTSSLATLRDKLQKQAVDLLQASNDKLATERRSKLALEEMKDLLERKDDEIEDLKHLVADVATIHSPDDSDTLRRTLEEKETKLRALVDGIDALEGKFSHRIGALAANMERRKDKTETLVRTSSSQVQSAFPPRAPCDIGPSDLLQRRIYELESIIASKEALFASSTLPPLHPTSPPVDTVPRIEYEALQSECIELEKELDAQQLALEQEREEASNRRQELILLKDELKLALKTREELGSKMEQTQRELDVTRSEISQLQATLNSSETGDPTEQMGVIESNQLSDLFVTLGRLRSERDELNRTLAFARDEARIRITTLEAERSHSTTDTNVLRDHVRSLVDRLSAARSEVKRLKSLSSATLITIQHLGPHGTEDLSAPTHSVHSRTIMEDFEPHIVESESRVESVMSYPEEEAGQSSHSSSAQQQSLTIEEERALLQERCAGLEDDVAYLQQQLDEAVNYAKELRDEHLAARESDGDDEDDSTDISSGKQFTGIFRKEIEQLELRIERRNEQIGIHQAEIARLETNFALLEDANVEMAAELETLTSERDCMVADCAEAREARDRALARIDALEEQVEGFASQLETSMKAAVAAREAELQSVLADTHEFHQSQVEALVLEIFSAMGRASFAEQSLASSHEALVEAAELENQLQLSENERVRATDEFTTIKDQQEHILSDMRTKESELTRLRDLTASTQGTVARLTRDLDHAKEELERKDVEMFGDHDTLRSTIASLQSQITTLDAAFKGAEEQIRTLHLDLASSRSRVDELQAAKESLAVDLEQQARDHLHEMDNLITSHDMQIINLQKAHGTRLEAESEKQEALDRRVQELVVRCRALELELSDAIAQAKGEHERHIDNLQSSHMEMLSKARSERDEAISTIMEQQDSLQNISEARVSEVRELTAELSEMTKLLRLNEENQRAVHQELGDARLRLAAQETSIRVLQEEHSSLHLELQTRSDEHKRTLGMKRFLEQDVKRLETEVSALKRQLTHVQEQVEQHRRRAQELDISSAQEKVRLESEAADLRREVQSFILQRDEALAKAASEEEQNVELYKAQRKRDIQYTMLKEKLRRIQSTTPQAPSDPSIPARDLSRSTSTLSRPLAIPARRVVSDVPPRRPTFTSRNPRSTSGVSILASTQASSSTSMPVDVPPVPPVPSVPMLSRPLASSQRAGSALLPNVADARHISPGPSSRISKSPFGVSPARSQSAAPDEPSSTGKRKRPPLEEDDYENRSPQPIIASPRSPSRMRHLAERGVRAFTPKRSVAVERHEKHDLPSSTRRLPFGLASAGSDITNGQPSSIPTTAPGDDARPPRKKGGMSRLTALMLTR